MSRQVPKYQPPPKPAASRESLGEFFNLLKQSKKPLVIVGKGSYSSIKICFLHVITDHSLGCSYGAAENEAKKFIEQFNLPFLATPMGKGTLDDRHPLSVGAARSTALQDSDCIILLGARLNWMLHFGKTPRFNPNVKIIQVNFYFLIKLIFVFLDIFRLILIQRNYIIIFKVH
jgi:2-hydroxyacyl-CoA lyase 1